MWKKLGFGKGKSSKNNNNVANVTEDVVQRREKVDVKKQVPEEDDVQQGRVKEENMNKKKKKRGSEIEFGGRLGDFVPPEDDEEEEEEEETVQNFNIDEREEEDTNDPDVQAAILEHSEVLGIDINKYPEFISIVKESLLAPVPEGWVEHQDEDGMPFYVDQETSESQWEHPLDDFYIKKYKRLLKEKKKKEKAERKKAVSSENNANSKGNNNNNNKKKQGPTTDQREPKRLNISQSVDNDNNRKNNDNNNISNDMPSKKEQPKKQENEEEDFLKTAILEQCKVLGIDPVKYPEYVYIAKESLLAPVPEGWEEQEDNGDPFYLQIATGKTQWEHPEDEKYRLKFKKELEKANVKSDNDKTTIEPSTTKKKSAVDQDWDDWDDIDDQDSTKGGENTTTNNSNINGKNNSTNKGETNKKLTSTTAAVSGTISKEGNDENEDYDDWDSDEDDDLVDKKDVATADKVVDPQKAIIETTQNKSTEDISNSQPSIVESSAFPLESSVAINANRSSPKSLSNVSTTSPVGTSSNGNDLQIDAADAKQIFQMESSMRLVKSENEDLWKRNAKLKNDKLSISNTHKKLTDEMQDKIDLIREESDKLKIEKLETENKLKISTDRLFAMKAENNVLKQKAEVLENSKTDLELSLTRSNKDQDEELGMVKNKIEVLTKEKNDLKLELHETKVSYEKLSSTTTRRVQTAMQTARSAQTARKQAEDRIKELEKQIKQTKSEKNSMTRALESEVKNAMKRARDAESEKATAVSGAKKKYEFDTNTLKDLQKKLEDASNNLISKGNRIKELQKDVKRLENENKELLQNNATSAEATKEEEMKISNEATGNKATPPPESTAPKVSTPPKPQPQINVDLYTSEIIRLKTELAASERRLRDAERLASKAEERADRAESSYTESAVENELATSLGIKVYELEREKEKLESLIRDSGVDKDLYKAQAEAALRERSQVLDRIKVEQKRNDELVSQRQRQSEEKIRLVAQLEQGKLSEERLSEMIKTLRKEQEESRKILNSQTQSVNGNKVEILNAVREERERLKIEHDKVLATLRKELLEAKQGNTSTTTPGSEYEGKFVALKEEIRLLKVENNALKSFSTTSMTLDNNNAAPVVDKTTGIRTSEKEAALAAQLQDVVRQSASTISTHIQEISALRSRISTLQEENSRLKIGASEDLETWKRRAAEAMAESEALRIERNERRVDMKELREEWKALHKELRDVKVQEMVARESAIRAETKLEKFMGDTDTNAASRMSSFLQDMRGIVEQVASFQASPHEALMDGSTSYALGDQSSTTMSPLRKSNQIFGSDISSTRSPHQQQYMNNKIRNNHNNNMNYPRAPESIHLGGNNMPPQPPANIRSQQQQQTFSLESNKYDNARQEVQNLREQLAKQQAQHNKVYQQQFGGI